MVDGQFGRAMKAGIIIQARLGSSRLPKKVLLDIGGTPLLEFLINRIKSSNLPIIVATTKNDEDDQIVSLAKKNNIGCFRGDEENVLQRYYFCAQKNKFDVIIRLTSDNPFLEGNFIKKYLELYLSYKSDNIYMATGVSKTYPVGISMEIFSFSLLESAYKEAENSKEKEHVTPYIYNKLPVKKVGIRNNCKKNHYRLTIDTPSDYKLAKTLVEDFDCKVKSVSEIIQVLDDNEDLLDINRDIQQKKWND